MARKKKSAPKSSLPPEFLKKLNAVTAKRPRIVIQHILKHGSVSTEELAELYGYDHAPRAARDVRELGIPLVTAMVAGKSGRKMAVYSFGDPASVRGGKIAGRKNWPKGFKKELFDLSSGKCAICNAEYESRYFQIDHRVPYEVGGDPKGNLNVDDYMLLCGSCNRAKSWSCEHCENWKTKRKSDVCDACYWAQPDSYKHIALRLIRRLDLTWSETEVTDFDRLAKAAAKNNIELPEFVKHCLRSDDDVT